MTSGYKVVEYARFMNNQQGSPEIVLGRPTGEARATTEATSGSITFNNPTLPPKGDAIAEAIANGDTTEKRFEAFKETFLPTEQK